MVLVYSSTFSLSILLPRAVHNIQIKKPPLIQYLTRIDCIHMNTSMNAFFSWYIDHVTSQMDVIESLSLRHTIETRRRTFHRTFSWSIDSVYHSHFNKIHRLCHHKSIDWSKGTKVHLLPLTTLSSSPSKILSEQKRYVITLTINTLQDTQVHEK